MSIEYDPNRSSFIGLYFNLKEKELFYDLVSENQKEGSISKFTNNVEESFIGNKMSLHNIPLGTLIHSLEGTPGRGSQYLRGAGTFGKVQKKDIEKNLVYIKMPSKKIICVSLDCIATIGCVSNTAHKNKNLAKAGRSR